MESSQHLYNLFTPFTSAPDRYHLYHNGEQPQDPAFSLKPTRILAVGEVEATGIVDAI